MMNSDFVDFALSQFQHTPLPLERRVNDGRRVWSARPLRIQNSGRGPANDAPFIIRLDEISERARERSEQRRLRRFAASKTLATTCCSYEIGSPGSTRASKPHSPPPSHTPTEVSNQPPKLTRKPSDQPRSKLHHQLSANPPLTPPAHPRRISATCEPRIPYSESRGELQRQFATSQGQHEHRSESPNLVEGDGDLGVLGQSGVRIRDLRLHTKKLLQSVSAHCVRKNGKGTISHPEKAKKVRFAAVVECFEF